MNSSKCMSFPATFTARSKTATEVPAERVWAHIKIGLDGRSQGFGHVRFPEPAAAERALVAMRGAMLDGRRLSVRSARAATLFKLVDLFLPSASPPGHRPPKSGGPVVDYFD